MEIKKVNRNRIYRLIAERSGVSKADIADSLKVSLPTVTQNVAALKELNLVVEEGVFESTGGRKPRVITCNPMAKAALGVNITTRRVDVVLVDLLGNVIDFSSVRGQSLITQPHLQNLREQVQAILARNAIDPTCVLGAGISLPAIIDGAQKICDTAFDTPLPDDLQELLQACLPFSLQYCNDASSGGFAEFWNSKEEENLFYFSLSATVGGAARIGGTILAGDDFRSAEVGHMTLIPGGTPCYCGQAGCINAYCSSSNLSELTDGDLELFFRRLEGGDADCATHWNAYLDHLATAIKNVRMLFDCDVILGGYIGKYIPRYLEQLRQMLHQRDAFGRPGDYVRACRYHSESSAVGAALLYVDQFIREI